MRYANTLTNEKEYNQKWEEILQAIESIPSELDYSDVDTGGYDEYRDNELSRM